MRRSVKFLVVCAVVAVGLATGAPSRAAGSTQLSAESPEDSWAGSAFMPLAPNCLSATVGEALCTTRSLVTSDAGTVEVIIYGDEANKWDVVVYDAEAEEETVVAAGLGAARFSAVEGTEYLVVVKPYLAMPGHGFIAQAILTPDADDPPAEEIEAA